MSDTLNEVGFTGPSSGMTDLQREGLRGVLISRLQYPLPNQPKVNRNRFHHGSCIGSDDNAGWIAHRKARYLIVVHPPLDPKKRAYSYYDTLMPEQDYLVRDRRMVDVTNFFVGTPTHPEPSSLRGDGTWYTLNYAFKVGRDGVIIWRNGEIEPFDQYLLRVPR